MKIAIMGAGGVGGYYGALLARAGRDVAFIARGPHLQAIRQEGLQVRSVFGDFRVFRARATDNPAELGKVDLVIFTTKTYQTEEAARIILPIIGPETVVLPLQNGVDAAERIGAVVGMDRVLGGTTWLSAAVEAPGVIGQYSQFRRIIIGELDGTVSARAENVGGVLRSTGATVELVQNMPHVLWTKFVFISAISAMGGMTRVTLGEYRQVPEARAILTEALREVAAVSEARGVHLDPEVVGKTLAFIDDSAPGIKPSMQRDIEAGRQSELESMVGVVVRWGEEHGVPTPVMRQAYAVLKPQLLLACR